MAVFMNEYPGTHDYTSFVSIAVGNAMREASEQITQALNDAFEEEDGFEYSETQEEYVWRNPSSNRMRTIILSVPNAYDHAPPSTYKLSIIPSEDIDMIKNVLQGAIPAGTAPAPAGSARRRKSRKSKKSKKVSRRRRTTRRY